MGGYFLWVGRGRLRYILGRWGCVGIFYGKVEVWDIFWLGGDGWAFYMGG